jgi:hypothetical protein
VQVGFRPQSPDYYRGPEGDMPMALVVTYGFHIPKHDLLVTNSSSLA